MSDMALSERQKMKKLSRKNKWRKGWKIRTIEEPVLLFTAELGKEGQQGWQFEMDLDSQEYSSWYVFDQSWKHIIRKSQM